MTDPDWMSKEGRAVRSALNPPRPDVSAVFPPQEKDYTNLVINITLFCAGAVVGAFLVLFWVVVL